MTFLLRIVLLFSLLFTISVVAAQQNIINSDEVYGSDPLLYNGRFYIFFPPLNTGGNQFFADSQFEVGSATLRKVTYTALMLNYDIYNQQLILKYKSKTGAVNLIIVSDAWLESFSFNDKNFEMISTQDTLKRIFQIIGTGPNRILYYWKKDLNLESSFGAQNHTFSAASKEMNLSTGNQILKYRNNKSFYRLFDPEIKIAVKEYLHEHKIKVKKATDKVMTDLISYCNTLYEK